MNYTNITEVCNIQLGKTPKRSESKYWGQGYSWVSIADMNSKFIANSKEEINDLAVKENNMKIVPENTLIMSFKLSIGKVGITKKELYTNEAIAAFIIKDHNLLLTEYLYYVLKSYNYDHLMDSSAKGKTLNKQKLEQIEIPLISIKEQEQIIHVLNKAENLLRFRQQQIEALSALKQSVFLDIFGDVTTNPYGFKIKSLTEFYADKKTSLKCGPFGSALKKSEYTNEGVPVWNMDNITTKNEFNGDVNLWIPQEKFEQLESYNVENDDVIISRAGTVGKMAVVKSQYRKSIISTNLIRLRFNDELLPEFFVMMLKIFGDRVARLRTGSDGSFTHMNTKVLNSIIFPYPPIELQQKYVNILNEIKVKEQILTHGRDNIKKLYDSLLYQAFNGKLFKENIKA